MITQKFEAELHGVLRDLERGTGYLLRDDVAGIAHTTTRPNGNDYTVRNLACVQSCVGTVEHVSVMNKHYGSHITGVYDGARRLKNILERVAQERKEKRGQR